jgi:hypothetical protein
MVGLTHRSMKSVVGANTAEKGCLEPHVPWLLPERRGEVRWSEVRREVR